MQELRREYLWRSETEEFLAEGGIRVLIMTILTTTTRGNWKIKNLGEGDYVLGVNCHLKDLYRGLPDAEEMGKWWGRIVGKIEMFVVYEKKCIS